MTEIVDKIKLLREEQLKLDFNKQNEDTVNTIRLFVNLWFYSMIAAVFGVGLYVSGISFAVGSFVAVSLGLISLISFVLSIYIQHGFSAAKAKFIEEHGRAKD